MILDKYDDSFADHAYNIYIVFNSDCAFAQYLNYDLDVSPGFNYF